MGEFKFLVHQNKVSNSIFLSSQERDLGPSSSLLAERWFNGYNAYGKMRLDLWLCGVAANMLDCLSRDRGFESHQSRHMGHGTAWGGHLSCKEEIRRVRFSYVPPICVGGQVGKAPNF